MTLLLTGLLTLAALLSILSGGRLTSGVFKNTESGRAQELVAEVTGHPTETTFVAIFQPAHAGQSADDVKAAMQEAATTLRADPQVAKVMTPEDAPTFLVSRMADGEGTTRVAYVTLAGTTAEALAAYPQVREKLALPSATVTATGFLPFTHDMNATLERDLERAELIALPLALLVLLLVFRTLVAAALPVAVGGLAVLGGIGLVFAVSRVTDVAIYSVNVCSLIGLGVSIDYSLFLVSRYREERDRGLPKDEAIVRAAATAGRTVAFSGFAVCTGLAGLLFFTGSYLFPMGLSGIAVVALAVLFALTVLPALLSLLGEAVFRGRIPIGGSTKRGGRFWKRLARGVMQRPVLVGLPTLVVLVAMGAPFLRIELAAADVRVLDHTVEARRGYELLKEKLPDQAKNRILIAVEFPTAPALTEDRIDALYDLSQRAKALPNVVAVDSVFAGDGTMEKERVRSFLLDPPFYLASISKEAQALSVGSQVVTLYAITDATSDSDAARSVVEALRANRQVADGKLVVGGETAHDIDATDFILSRAPHAIIFVVGATLVLLYLLLRSVLLPIKAVLMNFLSMKASFGALVWIFQEGHLGVTEPRPLEPTLPVLLFCVLFGLSMDYEVLLLSRIREAYRHTKDTTEAVGEGLQRTASLITSAAAIMVAVFIAFAFADVVMIQAVGVGMALAVALDATLVRSLLVPATMRLLGDLNWWAPSWKWLRRRGRRDTDSAPPVETPGRRRSHA